MKYILSINELFNAEPKGTILTIDDLEVFNIPDEIKNIMAKWDVIYKSPFSSTFYSSTDISWVINQIRVIEFQIIGIL